MRKHNVIKSIGSKGVRSSERLLMHCIDILDELYSIWPDHASKI